MLIVDDIIFMDQILLEKRVNIFFLLIVSNGITIFSICVPCKVFMSGQIIIHGGIVTSQEFRHAKLEVLISKMLLSFLFVTTKV